MCSAFLNYINNHNFMTICSGFNASQASSIEKAYDLPWIMNRANLHIRSNVTTSHVKSLMGTTEIAINRIIGLNNVIFIDYK